MSSELVAVSFAPPPPYPSRQPQRSSGPVDWHLDTAGSDSSLSLGLSSERGGFHSDLAGGQYNLPWDSMDKTNSWFESERQEKAIELLKVQTLRGGSKYLERLSFVCSRHGTGGETSYIKKNPHWKHKIPPKRTNCPYSLEVKTYPGVSTVLAKYSASHNHEIGNSNIRFTRISKETREWIAGMLRMKVECNHIVCVNQSRFLTAYN
jgi:hypothetical protein